MTNKKKRKQLKTDEVKMLITEIANSYKRTIFHLVGNGFLDKTQVLFNKEEYPNPQLFVYRSRIETNSQAKRLYAFLAKVSLALSSLDDTERYYIWNEFFIPFGTNTNIRDDLHMSISTYYRLSRQAMIKFILLVNSTESDILDDIEEQKEKIEQLLK